MFSRRNEEDEYTNVDFWAEKFFFGGGRLEAKGRNNKRRKSPKIANKKMQRIIFNKRVGIVSQQFQQNKVS